MYYLKNCRLAIGQKKNGGQAPTFFWRRKDFLRLKRCRHIFCYVEKFPNESSIKGTCG
jgi:hypothetical protein